MIAILCGVTGFVLGFLTAACYYNYQAQKSKRNRSKNRINPGTELPGGKARRSSAKTVNEIPGTENILQKAICAADPLPGERNAEDQTEKPKGDPSPKRVSPASEEEAPEVRMERLYREFQGTGKLMLRFNYSFPDLTLFQPGSGYLRNRQNELIPEKAVFSSVNSATGYAMEGLFWVFDMVRGDREYTFAQIKDGEAGTGYVQICSVIAPAVVRETGNREHYKLVQKGKLEVVDVQ